MIKKKSTKLFIVTLLSISMITGIFARQKQEVDALALTIPVVAIPIIKMLIATGLTFATTDAMIEAYNVYVKDTGMTTVTGAIRDQMQDYYQEITGIESVQDFLNKNFPSGQKPDPNDPEWNNYKNLTLGTIGVSVATKWDDLKTWISNKFKIGNNTYSEISVNYGDNIINVNNISQQNNIELGGNYRIIIIKPKSTPSYDPYKMEITYVRPSGTKTTVKHYINDTININLVRSDSEKVYFQLFYSTGTNQQTYIGPYSLSIPNTDNAIKNGTIPQVAQAVPYVGEEILNDPTRKHVNETTQKEEVMLPIPLELVEYDENQQKWVLNADKEIPIEQAKDMLKPLENKTYQDLTQETPQETNIPTEEPTPTDPTDPTEPTEPTEPDLEEEQSELTKKIEELKKKITDKMGLSPLAESWNALQSINKNVPPPPVIKVNLNAMAKSVSRKNNTLPTDAVLVDFAFMNSHQWSFMGYNLIELFRALVSMGMVITTLRYVWNKIVPTEVL